jgi:DNA-binding CsgD family transcriptional regulator
MRAIGRRTFKDARIFACMPIRMVGRERELTAVRGLVARRQHRRPLLVLVEGEAGIGKTTLLDALVESLDRPVRRASAPEDTGTPPYWLWRQLAPEALSQTDDRFTLFAALQEALAGTDCLLVIDDIHWADEPSLLALRLVLRDPACAGLVVCAARRSGEAGPGWDRLGPDLLAGPEVERLQLTGLDRSAARELLLAAAQAGPAETIAKDQVANATSAAAGNPLYLRELGSLLGAGSTVDAAAARFAEVVEARLRRLRPRTQRLLRAASVLADEFELAVAARVLDEPTAACLPAVDEALAAGLLLHCRPGRFRFTHGLVRRALEAVLPLEQSVAWHQRAAQALEDLHRDDPTATAPDIARHWAAAAITGHREPAVAWTRRAADEAARALAYEEAARLYGIALDCGGPQLAAGERGTLLLGRARARFASGELAQALTDCKAAIAGATSADDNELLVAAALVLEPVGDLGWDRSVSEWCTQALPHAREDAVRARLLARLAEARIYSGEVQAAQRPAKEAMAAAERSGDDDALVASLRARQLTLARPEYNDARRELATRMIGLGIRLRRPDVEMWGHMWRIDALWERGELLGIATEVNRLAWCVQQQRSPMARWHLAKNRAVLALARGELDAALAHAAEALAIADAIGHPGGFSLYAVQAMAVAHHRGHSEEKLSIQAGLARVDPGQVRQALFISLVAAFLLADSGRTEDAALHYRRVGPPRDWDIPYYLLAAALYTGATIAVRLGEQDDIRWFATMLEPLRHSHIGGGSAATIYFGPARLILGRCAAALDDLDAAAADLEAAAAECEAIGAPGFAVEAAYELAVVRERQGRRGDSLALVRQIRPAAARLGMAPWADRIDALLSAADPDPLSPREREVAALVAEGLSNRQIAERLVLSERTAGNHVQHILTKLDFDNRSQIATWATQRAADNAPG